MVIGMVMNPSVKILLGMVVHLHGAIRYGIESVVPTRMEMAGQIPVTLLKVKVSQAHLGTRMHSSMTQHNGTIQMEINLETINQATWVMNVQEKPEQV